MKIDEHLMRRVSSRREHRKKRQRKDMIIITKLTSSSSSSLGGNGGERLSSLRIIIMNEGKSFFLKVNPSFVKNSAQSYNAVVETQSSQLPYPSRFLQSQCTKALFSLNRQLISISSTLSIRPINQIFISNSSLKSRPQIISSTFQINRQ